MKRMQKRRIFTAPFMWRRKCQVAVGNSSSTSKTSQPSHPKKKNKVEKPYPLQPPTFPGRPFRQRRLCASKMPLLLPVVYMLYAPMYITSLRIASDTRVSPFFFLYHHAAPPKPFHKCLLRVPKLHSRSLSHPLSPSRSPLTSVVEWANFLAYECVCFVFHHYIFFSHIFPHFCHFFLCVLCFIFLCPSFSWLCSFWGTVVLVGLSSLRLGRISSCSWQIRKLTFALLEIRSRIVLETAGSKENVVWIE